MSFIKQAVLGTLSLGILATVSCGSRQAPTNVAQFRAPQQLNSLSARGNTFSTLANSFKIHFVKAYNETIAQNEPQARNDSNGPAKALYNVIGSARQTLDAALYDIGDMGIVNALITAHKKGVRVRVVTENQNIIPKGMKLDKSIKQPTRDTIAALQAAGIPIVDDNRSGLMHHKFIVADNSTVWMGSTNTTSTSLYNHNNNAMTLNNKQLAENYTYEFERMFVDKVFGARGPVRQIPHPVIKTGGTTIRTFFSPKGGGTEAILDVVNNAKSDISFMTFSFTDKNIANAMVAKKQAGLNVQGVYDQCLGYGKYSTYHIMRQNNVPTRMDGNEALLHHKVILVDNTVVTGSFNFSASADKSNNENMLIIEDSSVSSAYKQEYQRVLQAATNNNPPPNHCPGRPAPNTSTSSYSNFSDPDVEPLGDSE